MTATEIEIVTTITREARLYPDALNPINQWFFLLFKAPQQEF